LEIYNRLEDIDAVLVTPEGKVLYTKGLMAPPPTTPPASPPAISGSRH